MLRYLFTLTAIVALSACSSGDRGVLEPIKGEQVETVSTHGLPDDTARLRAAGVTADVTGLWSEQGESVEIRYRSGPSPARIDIAAGSTWRGQTVPATAAWDRSTPEPGNAIGRPLIGADALQLVPGASKLVQIEFDRAAGRPSIGDEVTVTVPMPGGARAARFRVTGE